MPIPRENQHIDLASIALQRVIPCPRLVGRYTTVSIADEEEGRGHLLLGADVLEWRDGGKLSEGVGGNKSRRVREGVGEGGFGVGPVREKLSVSSASRGSELKLTSRGYRSTTATPTYP